MLEYHLVIELNSIKYLFQVLNLMPLPKQQQDLNLFMTKKKEKKRKMRNI